jgi:uncharacterized protein
MVNCSFSQQLSFPHGAYADNDKMNKAMPELALRVIDLYKNNPPTDKISYYANLFRYEMISNQFTNALRSIDSASFQFRISDPVTAKTYAFPFRIYSLVMQKISRPDSSFELLFDSIFSNEYKNLSFKAADAAENYFKADLQSRQQRYLDLIKKLKQNDKDSISYIDAQNLCFSYLNYIVYTAEIQRVNQLLEIIINAKYIIEDSAMITMRDGSQISATIVYARGITTPQPAVLKFGIYSSESMVPEAKFIAAHGYASIIADTRGKRLSRQDVEPFEHDARDAYDIIDWISKQSWCNGKIGMYGGSYLGFTQWAAVKNVHPALKTIVPQVAVGIGIDFPGLYGIYWVDMLRWLHLVTNNKLTDWSGTGNKANWDSVRNSWYRNGTALQSLDSMEGRYNSIFQRFIQHPSYDEFWSSMVPHKQEYANINIPVLTITGYYDDDQRGAMYYFNQHHLYNKNPNHYLLIGPYDHYGAQGYPLDPPAVLHGYKIDSTAQIKIIDIVFEWFDFILKGGTTPALLKDKINFEVMGANKWRHTPSLQIMNNDTITFYLGNQQTGNRYKLLTKPAINNKRIKQKIDLADRTNFEGNEIVINGDGAIIDTLLMPGNYLCFVSDPLSQAYEFNGSFIASLNAIINKKDMDISIKLYEQMPDGRYFQLSNNIARCSYIKDFSKRQLLTPGKVENIFLRNTFFTSRYLQKGSRMVLLIGINNNPYWQINYGTGKDVSKETIQDAAVPLQMQWFTNKSYIKLPVWK